MPCGRWVRCDFRARHFTASRLGARVHRFGVDKTAHRFRHSRLCILKRSRLLPGIDLEPPGERENEACVRRLGICTRNLKTSKPQNPRPSPKYHSQRKNTGVRRRRNPTKLGQRKIADSPNKLRAALAHRSAPQTRKGLQPSSCPSLSHKDTLTERTI